MSEVAKPSMVDQIAEYVDSFLSRKAQILAAEKQRLSVYLRIVQSGKLEILLYCDDQFKGYVQMKEVLSGIVSMFSNVVTGKIVNGFEKFAQEHQYEITKLLLGLIHHENKLIYKVYYDNKPIEVNLEEFFTPKKEE